MADGLRTLVALCAVGIMLACADTDGGDSRPPGTLEDILTLHEREDLNVLFILVDTLRADRLGAYGYERATSPVIDSMAQTGIRFTQHIAQSSWTKCSMASLWTGLYPNRVGVLRAQHAVAEQAQLPAEIFREAGFRTTGVYRNGWVAPNFGFGQGFEVYLTPRPPQALVEDVGTKPDHVASSDADVILSAAEFLRAHADERWFLYLHLLDVHQYAADTNSAVFGSRYSDIYDNAILWTDSLIGHLLEELEKHGLRDRTLIVFASDHGEAFGEHGNDGHAYDVYGEVTETPFILSLPFRLDPGIAVESRSENVDLWPTLLALLGLPSLPDPDGVSLVPSIQASVLGETQPDAKDSAFAQIDGGWARLNGEPAPIVAVTEGSWRLIYSAMRPERPELFDKQVDPREQRNVTTDQPDITSELSDKASAYLLRSEAPWGEDAPAIEIDEMQLQQLRAIGYGVQ